MVVTSTGAVTVMFDPEDETTLFELPTTAAPADFSAISSGALLIR